MKLNVSTYNTIGKLLLLIFLLLQSVSFAQKTDIVIMNNGDSITGEVKSLQYAMLTFKTDDMGTLKIK